MKLRATDPGVVAKPLEQRGTLERH